MKTRHYIALLLSLVMGVGNLWAQSGNRLYAPDLTSLPGSTVSVPLNMDNVADILALQCTLVVPEGSTLLTETAQLTTRAVDHTISVRSMGGNEYLLVAFSPTNKALKGRTGRVASVDMALGSNYDEGSTLELELRDIVLTLRDGSNAVLADEQTQTVAITLTKRPDLRAMNVHADGAAFSPGDAISVSWQVSNTGGVATGAGWAEQISLIQADGTSCLLGITSFNNTLASGGVVSREAVLTIPAIVGLDGDACVQVKVVPTAETGESEGAQANNAAQSSETVSIGKRLTLTLPVDPVAETYARPIRCTLTRSGNRSADETFAFTATADSRADVPATVTIPAGQSAVTFYITLTDNDVIDPTSNITVSTGGNGYETVTAVLTIDDNEFPDLGITASATEVTEGEAFTLTITSSQAAAADVTLKLTSENTVRFTFPSQVTLPAGITEVTVEVQTVSDEQPATTLANKFTVSAERYNPAETVVILYDDDMPELTLTLTPSTVGEGDGPAAVSAVLRRTGKTDNAISVRLTDDTNGGIYYGTTTIPMGRGVTEASFTLGPVDDNMVNGDRTATITAAVYIPSCGCTSAEVGTATATLVILNDDGPALRLASSASTVAEGKTLTLTVTRNTDTTEALDVTVECSQEEAFEAFGHIVTIPAGSASASLQLTAVSNDVTDDSRTAVFTVRAADFAKGSCYVMLTDQTLPDARVALTAEATDVEVGGTTTLKAIVSNNGAAELAAGVQVVIYQGSTAIATLQTTAAIAVGESETLPCTVTLPATITSTNFYATVNENREAHELIYTNNTSATLTVQTVSPFTASNVATDKTTYLQGEPVIITGMLTGSAVAGQEVEVYIAGDGARQTVMATSDVNGGFTATITPYSSLCGHFAVGACYVGENLRTAMTAMDIYGLRRTSLNHIVCDLTTNEPYTGQVSLRNPGGLALTGVSAEVTDAPEGYTTHLTMPATIDGGQTVNLEYSILGTIPSKDGSREPMTVLIQTAEGATLQFPIYVNTQNALAYLQTSTHNLNTTMVKGQSRDYEITINNTGKGNSGKITLGGLPAWMTCPTGTTFPALDGGESLTAILRFTPTDDMALNLRQTGRLAINCETGHGTYIDYVITPVSEATGTLVVDVTDELTYGTDEAPHVQGATVRLCNPATGAIVCESTTGADGKFTVTIPEGYYQLNVTADNHDSYSNYICIDPGVETLKVIELSYNAISISWSVVETEVEDEYEIQTNVKFETNVPVPVVRLNVPGRIAADELGIGESLIFYATLNNEGLISALNTELLLPENVPFLTFQPLEQYQELKLAAKSSVIIPVLVTRTAATPEDAPCYVQFGTHYEWYCGSTLKGNTYYVASQIGPCPKQTVVTYGDTVGGGGWVIGGVGTRGGGGGGYTPAPPYQQVAEITEHVRATVSLQFTQTMTLVRQAFRGTLTIANGNQTTAMTDVRLQLKVTDPEGNVATSNEFEMHPENKEGFQGELALDAGWTLAPAETGTVNILFIPTKSAAPTQPVPYDFGGTLSYIDPFSGIEMSVELTPVTLTVNPTAELDLTYFLQRDVYGDDPMTEAVEASLPAEYALLINNVGCGEAKNVRLTAPAISITDYYNQDLLINFDLVGSQLNGDATTLTPGGATLDFGNIPAKGQAYAQWWFQSTRLGHFIDYEISATHVTSYNNPNLSLLGEVSIHELIRSIETDLGETVGFMVNDIPDKADMPDMLYFTDGTTAEVCIGTAMTIEKQTATQYALTVKPSKAGWNYTSVTDPTYGRGKLLSVRRQSDGLEISLRNVWQTDRTLLDGEMWLYENKIHLVDNFAATAETYTLYFEQLPEVELAVASFGGVPADKEITREIVSTVTVNFNKAIDPETFTAEDVVLYHQGTRLDVPFTITPLSNSSFSINLGQATLYNGYYMLEIQTATITDAEGFTGADGRRAEWIQFVEATILDLSYYSTSVTYGETLTPPTVTTNSTATPTYESSNPLVATVDAQTGEVTLHAVGSVNITVRIDETIISDAISKAYQLTVLQPEGSSEAPADVTTVDIVIPDGQTMATFCSPWPIDFSGATDECRAYMAATYHDDVVECSEVTEAKGGVGLLMVGQPGTYTFPVRTSFNALDENMFVGTLAPTYIQEKTDDKTNLGLKVTKFVPINDGVVKPYKAYLPLALDSNVKIMRIAIETKTGIRTVLEQGDDAAWFHVSGMKVNRPVKKGVYVQTGRKVVVK